MSFKVSKSQIKQTSRPLNDTEKMQLSGNSKRKNRIEEYLDKDRNTRDRYYDLTEFYESGKSGSKKVFNDMQKLILEDDYFLDPYLTIADIRFEKKDYNEYQNILQLAYSKAVKLITDKYGNYPEQLPWGWLENRHIIRAIDRYALMLWETGKSRLALEVYRKLLASNPNDNIGARFHILALRLGYDPNYDEEFLPKEGPVYGLDAVKMDKWFSDNAIKYKDEFEYFGNKIAELDGGEAQK